MITHSLAGTLGLSSSEFKSLSSSPAGDVFFSRGRILWNIIRVSIQVAKGTMDTFFVLSLLSLII